MIFGGARKSQWIVGVALCRNAGFKLLGTRAIGSIVGLGGLGEDDGAADSSC